MNTFDMTNENYTLQLNAKREKLSELFFNYTKKAIEVFPSATAHYRMRCEFRVWHDGDDLFFYMFDTEKKEKIRCDQFPPASKLINKMMSSLIFFIKSNKVLRHKLFQVDFLSTLSGEISVSLIYHKQLDDNWTQEARRLRSELQKEFKVNIIGRARKQKIELDSDYVIERLKVGERELIYKQVENSFTQPNAEVAIGMLEWVISVVKEVPGAILSDLLELYCGNGNFSIALAPYFRKVLATELAAPSVEAAQYNILKNNISNLLIVRMSAEDFSDAMKGTREYRRLNGVDLLSFNCKTILVDPPRAGLDQKAVELVSQYENIIYISCNPETLLLNVESLSKSHEIKRIALFDQFPYTHHMECGLLLSKKS